MTDDWSILLSEKDIRFVKSYAVHLNGTKAVKDAQFECKQPAQYAYELLRKPHILDALELYKAELAVTLGLPEHLQPSPERTIKELARLAYYDPRGFYNADGSIKPVHELDDDTAAVLEGFEVEEIVCGISAEDGVMVRKTTKIKLPKKQGANELLGKHYGIFERDNKQSQNQVIIVKDMD